MNSACKNISAVLFSNSSAEEILENLKPYVSLGDSVSNIEARNNLKFIRRPHMRPRGGISQLQCEECGLWISATEKYGVNNIVRLRAIVGTTEYPELKLGEMPLPNYFPFDTEEEMSANIDLMQTAFRKSERNARRQEMPILKRIWSMLTEKD